MVLKRASALALLIGALTGCETLVMPGSTVVVPVGTKQEASRPTVLVEDNSTLPEQQVPAQVQHDERVRSPEPFSPRPAPEPVLQDHSAARLPVVSKLLAQCQSMMEQENWPQAQQRLEQALRLAPQDPEIFLLYGDWHAQQGNSEGARDMYQRARSLAGKGTREAQSASEKLEQL